MAQVCASGARVFFVVRSVFLDHICILYRRAQAVRVSRCLFFGPPLHFVSVCAGLARFDVSGVPAYTLFCECLAMMCVRNYNFEQCLVDFITICNFDFAGNHVWDDTQT